ncbi:MAG: cation diffusion facilitator family transporter [Planctomycetota bacterium]|jgi:cation diffusion facilitator family transporter
MAKYSNHQIRRVTYLGIFGNILLSVLKLVVGAAGHSMALVADGVHSISDMFTDIAVLLGVHFGSKEADSKHPYGHGKIETFSEAFVAAALVVVGGVLIQRASIAIARYDVSRAGRDDIGWLVFWVAVVSIVVKEVLYLMTRKVAVKTCSSALYANAWHHRSDALSSIAVVIGFISLKFGYDHGDEVATIVVGLLIVLVGIKILVRCFEEFAERSTDSATIGQIESIIASEEKVRQWHKLRTRNVGREVFVDVHILVDPQLNITAAHEIAESLEDAMHNRVTRPVNITVHVEPDRPELRK